MAKLMTRKKLNLFALTILGMCVAFAIIMFMASIYLFKSPSGRNFIKTQIETQIAQQTGGTVTIESLETGLPSRIILKNISIDDDNNKATPPLLTAKTLKVNWRPTALLNKHVFIEDILIDHAVINHLPKRNSGSANDKPKNLTLPSLNTSLRALPHISLNNLSMQKMIINPDIFGDLNESEKLIVDGQASLISNKGELLLTAIAQNETATDFLKINTNINLHRDVFDIKANITSLKQGFLTRAINADDQIDINITGKYEEGHNIITAAINADTYGVFQSTLKEAHDPSSNKQSAQQLEGNFITGKKLASISKLLGNKFEFSISANTFSTHKNKQISTIQLHQVQSKAGTMSGTIKFQNQKNILQGAFIEINHFFAKDFQPDLQKLVGETMMVSGNFAQDKNDDYKITLGAVTPKIEMMISDGQTDFSKNASGTIKAVLKQGSHTPQLHRFTKGEKLSINGDFKIDNATTIEITDGKIELNNNTLANIYGVHDLNTLQVDAHINANLNASLLSRFNPSLQAQNDLSSTINLTGSLDDLIIDSTINLPEIIFNDQPIPSSQVNVKLNGLPNNLKGRVTGTTDNKNDLIDFTVTGTNEIFSLKDITYQSDLFKLAGELKLNPSLEALAVDLQYQGERNAKPFPALSLYGDVSIKGELSNSENVTPLHLKAKLLGSDAFTLKNLDIIAQGTLKEVSVTTKLQSLENDGQKLLRNLIIDNTLSMSKDIDVLINQASGIIFDNSTFKTNNPAAIRFGDVLQLKNLDLAYEQEGILKLDATISPTRWQAEFSGKNIFLAQSDAKANLSLSLDTQNLKTTSGEDVPALSGKFNDTLPANNPTIAKGVFAIDVNNDDPKNQLLNGAFSWDGKSARIFQPEINKQNEFLTFDITAPINLIRDETQISGLSLEGNDPLQGEIKLDGRIERIIALLANLAPQPSPIEGLEGDLKTSIKLSGTTQNPEFILNGTLRDAAYTDIETGLSIIGLHGDVITKPSGQGNIISFTAGGRGESQQGDDRFSVIGDIVLGEENSIKSNFKFDDLELSASPLERLQTTGIININGPLNAINATGTIDIDRMDVAIIPQPQTGLVDIDVIILDNPADNSGNQADPSYLDTHANRQEKENQSSLLYNITINADDKIFIRGRGLESEWTSNLTMKNEGKDDLILGDIELKRGTFDFSGRRFDVTQGKITFDQLTTNDPVISINAEYDTGNDIIARVTASGRASDIAVELSSTPVRPPNDVMALILFGKPSEDLSAIESIQTAQALASLGGIGPFSGGGLVNGLRKSTGLDLLNIDIDPTGGASSLTVGKYIADGLFISASQDIKGQNGAVRVEYEVKKNITLESNIRQDGNQSISANWKRDF